jgi:hypothetical protein
MNPNIPRVAVCIPSGDLVHADMAMNMLAMGASCRDLIVSGHNCKREVITKARNKLVREALENPEATHVLFVDSDHMFPMDSLRQLIRRDKEIVGCFYEKRQAPYGIAGEFAESHIDVMKDTGLKRAVIIPGGFILVRRDVYEKLSPPWYREIYTEYGKIATNPDGLMSEDTYFCKSAHEAGLELWCDLDLSRQIWHMGTQHVPFGAHLPNA